MKNDISFILLLIGTFVNFNCYGIDLDNDKFDSEINEVLKSFTEDVAHIQYDYQKRNVILYKKIRALNMRLANSQSSNAQIKFLILKDQLKDQLAVNVVSESNELSKIRYLKGLQIIKILFEKIVSLDHHFASVVTFNEISKISNPNYYPEFNALKENISASKSKKRGFTLSTLLGDNIYTSVLYSFMSLFTNTQSSKEEKERNLMEVECILDFTLRMHNDLNTIYFETAFLQKSNDNIMDELEQLFVDYTKPIQYLTPLKECRNSDDWDSVKEQLNQYLSVLIEIQDDLSQQYKAHKMRINLEFPIDRLLQFIAQYNVFIDQGSKFYEKFGIMLNSYENEEQCASKIPIEYINLKENIAIAIEKFNTAYKPVEINGSKMKEILYGINEYD